jgi:hypothetical protein
VNIEWRRRRWMTVQQRMKADEGEERMRKAVDWREGGKEMEIIGDAADV